MMLLKGDVVKKTEYDKLVTNTNDTTNLFTNGTR